MWVKRDEKEVWRVDVERLSDVYITGIVGEVRLSEIANDGPEANDVPQ
jgi:hypothetical protein